MERKNIDDQLAEAVNGGSIIFSTDHTTCGLNRDNQCKVNDYDKALQYVLDHYDTMSEKDIMRKLVALGYITKL